MTKLGRWRVATALTMLLAACGSDANSDKSAGAAGSPAGGGESGGNASLGGNLAGGDSAGGASTAGASSGGASTGGVVRAGAGSGGTSTGGRSTGGTSTGGRDTGGTSTGGTSTGGASTGGTSTGGNGTVGDGTGGGAPGDLPTIGGCTIFTADDLWNTDVYDAPVDATWTSRVQAMAGGVNLHPDFGGQGIYGIGINVVPESQPMVPIDLTTYADESDPGPYPFPGPNEVQIEGANPTACDGDCHLLVLQQGACMLYEGGGCEYRGGQWHCGAGAIWDLSRNSYGQRPMGWTSVDAAGLSVTAGLLRYEEVVAGAVRHAIRFTLECTTNHYVPPATHYAVPGGCSPTNAPPMGLRVRLNRDFDPSGFGAHVRTILTAMKHYGMILADNGSNFFFQGDMDPAWPDNDLDELKSIPSSAFEVVGPVGPLGP